jgi:pimeloyl-ACP methyl ester carboxylesterase
MLQVISPVALAAVVLLVCCRYFLDLSASRPGTQFALLQGVGHCPQDDRQELLHQQLLPWLKQRWS